jgi:Integrase
MLTLQPELTMPRLSIYPPSSHSSRLRPPPVGRTTHQPPRLRDWAGLTDADVLARHRPGQADPLQVLEVLLRQHNQQHTSRQKTVSHKTRQDRADFLRRFYAALHDRAGLKTLPDPRNLGQKHIRAMVQGFVRGPAFYGLELHEYQRHEVAERDKSWSAQGLDIDALLQRVSAYDAYVGASLRVIQAFGLRKKESMMLRPNALVVPFEATGLPPEERQADRYLWVRQGAKNGRPRYLPLDTPQRQQAVAHAQRVAGPDPEAHLGRPDRSLKQNMQHFAYVLRKFGFTKRKLGVTAHGLRHEALIGEYVVRTGQQPPVRGGAREASSVVEAACLAVSKMAGHSRPRASRAYLGTILGRSRQQATAADTVEAMDEPAA